MGFIHCKLLKMVLQFKYLGVIIDYELKWSEHRQIIKNKIRRLATLTNFKKFAFLINQLYNKCLKYFAIIS